MNNPSLKITRFLILAAILVVILLLLSKAGTFLEKSDPVTHGDALVPLMGATPEVVLHTLDLFRQGIAPVVVFGQTTTERWKPLEERGIHVVVGADQFREIALQLGIPADRLILLPGNNESTLEEARMMREYVLKNPSCDTMILVCSQSHSRRAGMIFRKVFKKSGLNVHLVLSTSPYSPYDGRRWWADREKVQTVVYEWIKLLSFVLVEQWKL